MSKGKIISLIFAALLAPPAWSQVQSLSVGQFPPLDGSNTYRITPADANLIIDRLYLPKGFRLYTAPDVMDVDWSVKTIAFEEDVTIDLSANPSSPPRGSNGAPPPPQAGYCTTGGGGAPGGNGGAGRRGVDMMLRNVQTIEQGGSLWIQTDGARGGDGGNGGDGQMGGGHRSVGAGLFHGGACDGADGGNGGRAGAGGAGGRTGHVTILLLAPGATIPSNDVAAACGPTTRPPQATGNTGVISIYGGSGCDGASGQPGNHGGHG